MATAGGPDIERDGLVFGYDTSYGINTNNISSRFYPGEPTTNYVTTNLETLGTDGSGQGSIGTRTTIAPNHVKIVDINSNTRQTHFISGLTGGTIYTVSIQFKKIEGTPTFRFQLQDYNGGSYLRTIKFTTTAETGLEDKYGWQTASWTFTLGSDANAVRIWWQDGADYTTYTHSFELKNPQLEAKNHVTPYASGTRSATQSLIDLTRTSTIDVSNVSFDSTGQPTFDGTDDYMQISLTGINLDSSCTIEGVLKRNSTPTAWRTFFNIKPSSATTPFFEFRSNANSQYIYADYYSGTDYATNAASFPTGNYGHAVATYDGNGNLKMYFNGELIHTKTGVPSFALGTSPRLTVGRAYSNDRYTDIEAPVVKIYNRALTVQEVQQNYNAYKNRFNL